jgi:hypothetical protein
MVLRTDPHHTAQKVPLDKPMQVVFMVDINVQTLDEGSVMLFNMGEQKTEPVQIEYRKRTMQITPVHPLQPLTNYQLKVVGGEDGIKDITGQMMPDTFVIDFHSDDVKEIKPPVLLAPTDQSELVTDPQFSWSPAEHAYYYQLEISKSNTFDVLVWPKEPNRIFETNVIPEYKLENGTYYARIRSVKDDGIRSAYTKPIQFLYSGAAANLAVADQEPEQDQLNSLQDHFAYQLQNMAGALSVIQVSPASNTVNLPIAQIKEIVIEFSEDVDPASLKPEWFYVVAERN